ncbi:hypothetical protein [Marinobacterium marinum]|uniref:Uncharacterized protein n=1 Tax=Marinobacterium marinum TaxID=2756129 RepID=A0A7W2ABA4_9GAMM|nr:hypothetical protein [Marinobacterium marinum]MBA4500848.1 hypothetical protein [Marinobacterium marinum]
MEAEQVMPILILFIGLMTGLLLGTIVPLKSIAEQGGIQADTGILYDLSIGIPAGILTGVIVSAWFGHASFLRERLDSMARELREGVIKSASWDNADCT